MTTTLECATCGDEFTAIRPGALTCSNPCRTRLYRRRLIAQRQRLADNAAEAIRSGDIDALTAAAHATVAHLTP